MYYAVHKRALPASEVQAEKDKVLQVFADTSPIDFMAKVIALTKEGTELSSALEPAQRVQRDANYRFRSHATFATICAYATVLDINCRVYHEGYYIDVAANDSPRMYQFLVH
jgi:hypothetical protein